MEWIAGKSNRKRKIILALKIFWCAAAAFLALKSFSDLRLLWLTRHSEYTPSALYLLAFIFDLWSMAGLAGLYSLRIDLRPWIEKHPVTGWFYKRWLVFFLSTFLIMGRLSVVETYGVAFLMQFIRNAFIRFLTYVFIAPVVQVISGIVSVLLLVVVLGTCFMVFIRWPMVIFASILQVERELKIYKYAKAGILGYLVRFAYWLAEKDLPPAPPDESKGARFATEEEIWNLFTEATTSGDSYDRARAIGFGYIKQPPPWKSMPVFLRTEKHVLIMASTRSGKGVTLIIPHLLRYVGSAFVLDPKGENARATGRRRAELNGKVHYLDPFGISGKPQSRFNPLSRFTPENMEAESKALAAALVLKDQDNKRDHWTASAQQLIAAIILHVFTSPSVPPAQKDIPTVRRLLLGNLDNVFKEMIASTAADGLLSMLAKSFVRTPEKELGSIISSAQRETEILDNPFITACLSASGKGEEVNFFHWRHKTMTVYLCLSAPKFPVFNRWLRLVLTSALDEMTDRLQPTPLPVCFMLDELATLGHMTAVENAVGLAAGYGIQLFSVFQDIGQMKDLYRGRWSSFIGNAGIRALFNLDDYDTARYWSDTIGGRIAQTTGKNTDIFGYYDRLNIGETMRPLMSPEKMMLYFSAGKMLILPQGSRPIISDRVAYFDDDTLDGFWDDPRKPENQFYHYTQKATNAPVADVRKRKR